MRIMNDCWARLRKKKKREMLQRVTGLQMQRAISRGMLCRSCWTEKTGSRQHTDDCAGYTTADWNVMCRCAAPKTYIISQRGRSCGMTTNRILAGCARALGADVLVVDNRRMEKFVRPVFLTEKGDD